MTEYDSTEVAYKRGYAQAIKDVFEKIDSILRVDISHSYMSDSFILSQDTYVQTKKDFFKEINEDCKTEKITSKPCVEKYPLTKYKNLDDFREKHCMMCGSQLCGGPYGEFADGCYYLRAAVFEDGSKPI